jgi:phytoene synthase
VVNPQLAGAYAYCDALARAHYENFPVASWLLPGRMRPHVAAIYAFARLADDIADEGPQSPSERLADLDRWDARLDAAICGEPQTGKPHAEVFIALRESIRVCRLPVPLLHDLVSAFRQDVIVSRYATWEDLLDYCRRSANPVGRLVLRVAGYERRDLEAASDDVCTALQLTNFWQDLEIDWMKGRIYLPESLRRSAGAREEDLSSRRVTPEWRAALMEATRRTRELFRAGRPVCDGVHGRLRWELRATWLGGTRILDKLEGANFDVFTKRPTLTAADVPRILWRTTTWARPRGSGPQASRH